MNRMLYHIIALLLFVVVFTAFKNATPKGLDKYKYLFRNCIYGQTKRTPKSGDTVHELAPVMRGKAYRPFYIYMPQREQYMVCSNLQHYEEQRRDTYAPPYKETKTNHVLMDKKGQIIQELYTNDEYSINTGLFFTTTNYYNWLDTGDSTTTAYADIYNKDLKMDRQQFGDTFRELYAKAELMEYVNLRERDSDIGVSIVFKIDEAWYILYNNWRDNNIWDGNDEENTKTGVRTIHYKVIFAYYDADSKRTNPYPQLPSFVESVYLETKNTKPNSYHRWFNNGDINLVKYHKKSSTGWQGVAKINGIPIYVPGTGEGIAYMKYKMGKETFRFCVPDVTKIDYISTYAIGVRSFKLPKQIKLDNALVFIESTQHYGHELRAGGGIYVIRPCAIDQRIVSDLPKDISEERYRQLPLSIQIGLLNVETTTLLECDKWYPEISYLVNLEYLKFESCTKLPDGIAPLKKLEVLEIESCGLKYISSHIGDLKQLKILNISYNYLKTFPSEICQLSALKKLAVGGNDISEIPDCIVNLSQLVDLHVPNNVLLPDQMMNNKALKITRD